MTTPTAKISSYHWVQRLYVMAAGTAGHDLSAFELSAITHRTIADSAAGAIPDQCTALGLQIGQVRWVAASVVRQRCFGEPERLRS